MSVITLLQEAREVLAKEENWTTDKYARDKEGRCVSAISSEACSFCAIGALLKVARQPSALFFFGESVAAYTLLQEAAKETGGFSIENVNDRLGYAAVITAYDVAIKKAKGQS